MSAQSTRGGCRLLGVSKNPRSGLSSVSLWAAVFYEITVILCPTLYSVLYWSFLWVILLWGFCCSTMLTLASETSSLAAADGGVSQRDRTLHQHVEHYWRQLICRFLFSAAEKVFVISFQDTDVAAGDVWVLLGQDLWTDEVSNPPLKQYLIFGTNWEIQVF